MALSQQDPRQSGRDRSDGETKDASDARGGESINAQAAGAEYNFLQLIQACETSDEQFKGAIQKQQWKRAYDAFHNRHASDSKYADPVWRRKRTALFRPKTRSAVRRGMATAAASLFTSSDVVNVSSEIENDPKRSASAAICKELLAYRLDRTATKSGLPWFQVVMGAHLDGQITGIIYTKQMWEYEVVTERATEIVKLEQFYADTGEKVTDPNTGEPIHVTERRPIEKEYVTKDRPWVVNYPADNVIIDPAAYWVSPAQSSSYLILKTPITINDARTMFQNPGKSHTEWLQITDEMLRSVCDDYTSKGVRLARSSDGADSLDNRTGTGKTRNDIVWLYECYYRIDGVDWCFWTLGSKFYASKVRTTREAYPEQRGERPVVRGYASLETHETFPMSPVNSWQEMQKELNDIVNLRLDNMKQALSPIAKVRQGSTFDFSQLQNRAGQDTTIIVRNMDDLEFDRTPDVTGSAYQESDRLNSDFDDLAGQFNNSSVSTNRNLNETVGGMQMLQGSSNAMGEFDLRVFIETWVEPTLRQLVRLEQTYETDEVVLAIAGQRAKMFERFGVDQITDEDLEKECTVRVNVGLGSADPMARLNKLALGLRTLAPLLPFMDKQVKIKAEEIIKEVMGAIGYHDGMRFVELLDPQQQGQGMDPAAAAMQGEQMKEQTRMQVEAMKGKNAAEEGDKNRQHEMALADKQQQNEILTTIINMLADLKKDQSKQQTAMQANTQRTMAGMVTNAQRQQSQERQAQQRGFAGVGADPGRSGGAGGAPRY